MSRPVLSHVQFANTIGASREYATGIRGKRSGYYVSRDNRTPIQVGGSLEHVSNTPHDVDAVKEHWDATRQSALSVTPTGWMTGRSSTAEERSRVHQGVWNDTKDWPGHVATHKTYLDISDREPSLSTALKSGVSQNQLSIYAGASGSKGRTLPTHFEKDGVRTVNPRAVMVAKSEGIREAEMKEQRDKPAKQKRIEKEEALSAFDKAFPRKTQE